MPGISTSVMSTSGRCSRTMASAAVPSLAWATTSMSLSSESSAASAPSTMRWSSAMTTLILCAVIHAPWRRPQTHGELGSDREELQRGAAERFGSRADAAHSDAFLVRSAAAVVRDLQSIGAVGSEQGEAASSCECRRMFVTASRTISASTRSLAGGISRCSQRRSTLTSAAFSSDSRSVQLRVDVAGVVAVDCPAHFLETLPCDALDVADLEQGALRVGVKTRRASSAFEREARQRVAHDVV